ncbi:HelD family protein [Gleimia hominis]|uniref:HelD family protein n=1 Tax=Gleimia hominis TaxID=595468 RepID=UPI000C809B61|nr:UvrD-helicase domain-containing protein [Gleimia hominis]WIK64962.1 ATP-dependent DNA helicase [Gleimia hominis]
MANTPLTYQQDLEGEQAFVNRAYSVLDALRARYRARQRRVQGSRLGANPQAYTERDALSAHWGDEAARLESIGERLVFGRLDMTDGARNYIGRAGLRDDEGNQVLMDWRAPAARPFYQATAAHPLDVVRRRHIQTQGRTVVALEDESLDTPTHSELTFQGEGALMRALSQARDGHMSDIVSTIQAEQDEIIRRPADGLLVIQGGPGTGKTAVVLHRAAYLLYAHRARLESSGVLIVGPSPIFLRYIDQVLPSLGETGVVSTTLSQLVPGYKAAGRDREEVARIKGDTYWIKVVKNAVRSLERVPADTPLAIAGYNVVLRSADVAAARSRARRSGRPHNEAWESFAYELMENLARQMDAQVSAHSDLEWYYDYIRGSKAAQRAINLSWLPMSALKLLERLFASPKFLAQCAPRFSAEQVESLMRPRGSALTESDIPILDELEEQLGDLPTASAAAKQREQERRRAVADAAQAIEAMGLGGGMVSAQTLADRSGEPDADQPLVQRASRDRSWAYGHIIVDEAQELSPMAWHILLRRCPSRSFTVTGDLDQSSYTRATQWSDLLGPAMRAYAGSAVLTVSYRTPAQILDRAQAVMEELGLPLSSPLVAARDIEDAYVLTHLPEGAPWKDELRRALEEELKVLDSLVGADRGRLAVILDPERHRDFTEVIHDGAPLDPRVVVLTPTAAKGLEFDTVLIVEPGEIAKQSAGDLYVAMTRPTQRLRVLAQHPIPHALSV